MSSFPTLQILNSKWQSDFPMKEKVPPKIAMNHYPRLIFFLLLGNCSAIWDSLSEVIQFFWRFWNELVNLSLDIVLISEKGTRFTGRPDDFFYMNQSGGCDLFEVFFLSLILMNLFLYGFMSAFSDRSRKHLPINSFASKKCTILSSASFFFFTPYPLESVQNLPFDSVMSSLVKVLITISCSNFKWAGQA